MTVSEAVGDGGTKRCESIKKLQNAGVLRCKQVVRGALKWLPFQVTTKLIVV